ncbi:hypothetical protein MNBD_GAMMA07-1502 [hydrothermal vent metagenome]|uniref:FHA domain-containing protein n=1 Tax=hydrothermal vent metagenome TaxID=652676 RepID=A0A3B0X2N7_9ZZZZ
MATLINTQTQKCELLLVQHTFGRHPTEPCTTLKNPEASRLHAVIVWNGEHWFLQDLSTNGTVINDVRIESSCKTQLKKGDKINFGTNNSDVWVMDDVHAPQNMLLAITPGLVDIVIKDIVVLPSEEHPEVTIYMASEGYWICESKAGISKLNSGDKVGIQGSIWSFVEAKAGATTQAVVGSRYVKVLNIASFFEVSQNEEHVSLNIQVDNKTIDLGQRNHHYLLLLLARKYIEDKSLGIIDSEQGWIDKRLLSKMSGLNENHINIYIYRFRKQLIELTPQHLTLFTVIETRRGEIRFYCDMIKINGEHNSKACQKSVIM